jgi:hypothetical protein
MKRNVFKLLSLLLIYSCSSTNENIELEKYEYDIQRLVGKKQVIKEGTGSNNLFTLSDFKFAIDTLEIRLNNGNGSFGIVIKNRASQDIVTPASRDTKCHVNFLYFSDYKTNWSENNIKKIHLESFLSGSYPKDFTYSESNLDLTLQPELFIITRHIPTYKILEKKPKIEYQITTMKTNENYIVGEIISYNSKEHRVLEKRTLN